VVRSLVDLHDRDGYARALERVEAARATANPAAVADRWAEHLARFA
jgi:hypothetical protein